MSSYQFKRLIFVNLAINLAGKIRVVRRGHIIMSDIFVGKLSYQAAHDHSGSKEGVG